MSTTTQPRYRCVRSPAGATTLKCWLAQPAGAEGGDPIVLWELRKILVATWGESVDTSRFLRHMRSEVQEAMALAGLEASEEIIMSFKAWRAQHPSEPPPAVAQEEFQVTTEGLLAMLSQWCSMRRLARHRAASQALLGELFANACGDDDASQLLTAQACDATLRLCPASQERSGACGHYLRAYDLAVGGAGDLAKMPARFAECLAKEATTCPACRGWFSEWLPEVASRLVPAIQAWESDPLKARPEHLSSPTGKRRRVDADYKVDVRARAIGRARG